MSEKPTTSSLGAEHQRFVEARQAMLGAFQAWLRQQPKWHDGMDEVEDTASAMWKLLALWNEGSEG